jgi:hypothetical protein
MIRTPIKEITMSKPHYLDQLFALRARSADCGLNIQIDIDALIDRGDRARIRWAIVTAYPDAINSFETKYASVEALLHFCNGLLDSLFAALRDGLESAKVFQTAWNSALRATAWAAGRPNSGIPNIHPVAEVQETVKALNKSRFHEMRIL